MEVRRSIIRAAPESPASRADFYCKEGGGPVFDMGPYFLYGACYILGSGCACARGRLERLSMNESHMEPATARQSNNGGGCPAHAAGLLEFASGGDGEP